MASIAGIAAVVVRRMTRRASSVVVAIQHEEPGMIERGRLPVLRCVTLAATDAEGSMNAVRGRLVTGLALIPDWRAEQRMGELVLAMGQFQTCVVAMTVRAALPGQFLVEGGLDGCLGERDTLGGSQPDISNRVTLHAAPRINAPPR